MSQILSRGVTRRTGRPNRLDDEREDDAGHAAGHEPQRQEEFQASFVGARRKERRLGRFGRDPILDSKARVLKPPNRRRSG